MTLPMSVHAAFKGGNNPKERNLASSTSYLKLTSASRHTHRCTYTHNHKEHIKSNTRLHLTYKDKGKNGLGHQGVPTGLLVALPLGGN